MGAHRLQSQLQRLSDESQDFQATCSRETANVRFRFFCDGEEKKTKLSVPCFCQAQRDYALSELKAANQVAEVRATSRWVFLTWTVCFPAVIQDSKTD